MSEHEAPITPAHIWRDMTPAQRLAAAGALWADSDSVQQQVEAVHAIARQLHFRPQSVLKLAPEKRARHLAALRTVSESLASRALVVYHLTAQRPMLEAFLDKLGIAHENGMIARQLHFRPQSVLKLAPEKRARHLAALRAVPESLASRALVVYHLTAQRPMLEAFLDKLGIAHENGMIAESAKDAPDASSLREAAAALLAAFPAADVRVYLRTLAVQDPATWGPLGPIVSELIPS